MHLFTSQIETTISESCFLRECRLTITDCCFLRQKICYDDHMHLDKYDYIEAITDSKKLKDFCDHLAHEEKSGFITVDTEFMRRTTFWPKLCLIQVAGSSEIAIIDPLADSLDLNPFYDLMRAPQLVKVFHSARQDLELFYHDMKALPHPLFDTQ